MAETLCKNCGQRILMQIYKNTGYCCENCKEAPERLTSDNITIQE